MSRRSGHRGVLPPSSAPPPTCSISPSFIMTSSKPTSLAQAAGRTRPLNCMRRIASSPSASPFHSGHERPDHHERHHDISIPPVSLALDGHDLEDALSASDIIRHIWSALDRMPNVHLTPTDGILCSTPDQIRRLRQSERSGARRDPAAYGTGRRPPVLCAESGPRRGGARGGGRRLYRVRSCGLRARRQPAIAAAG